MINRLILAMSLTCSIICLIGMGKMLIIEGYALWKWVLITLLTVMNIFSSLNLIKSEFKN